MDNDQLGFARQKIAGNIYFKLFVVLWFAGGVFLLFIKKGDVVFYINEIHTPFFDHFFKYVTHLGDGVFYAVVTLALLLIHKKRAGYVALVGVVHGILIYFFKKVVFHMAPRPTKYFPDVDWNYVEGVTTHSFNSFPSGHTASAFALMASLAIILDISKWVKVVFFCIALLVGLSRIYLLQHFYVDTYAGALVGTLCAMLIFVLLYKWLYASEINNG
jgi:membrane-associated phospholipid phosphatase